MLEPVIYGVRLEPGVRLRAELRPVPGVLLCLPKLVPDLGVRAGVLLQLKLTPVPGVVGGRVCEL